MNHHHHHELLLPLDENGRLSDRELVNENADLRRQLAVLKGKYDALLVEHEQLKASGNRMSQQQEVKQEIKEEIKEEDDDDEEDHDCDGWDRVFVKRELVSDDDDDDNSMQLDDSVNSDEVMQPNLNQPIDISSASQLTSLTNSVPQCATASATEQQMQLPNSSSVIGESVDRSVIGPNGIDRVAQCTRVVQSSDANMDQVINRESGLADVGQQDLAGDDEQLTITTNDNHDPSAIESNEPSTSAQGTSNRITSTQPTGSTSANLTKRKHSQQPNQTVKRSKKTVEHDDDDDDGGEDGNIDEENIAYPLDEKIKVIHFDCTEANCKIKSNSLNQLYGHLHTTHGLLPLRCFAQNCNLRFANRIQMALHNKHQHSSAAAAAAIQFVCHVCHKQFPSQLKCANHWLKLHLTGQFQCNLAAAQCAALFDTRKKVWDHLVRKHCPESSRFKCHYQAGCSASFATKYSLQRHEASHLASSPFHCNWQQCRHRANLRTNLILHIRTQHFGLPRTVKEQKAKNIVDVRDPNEFVRVVAEQVAE